MKTNKKIAIFGATGVVGEEMIKCLHGISFPKENLVLVASNRSKGKRVKTLYGEITIEGIKEDIFVECDIALFAVGSEVVKEWLPIAKRNNCLVIDNSSAFRYEKDVPLVIPEINGDKALSHKGIISNPNCTTAILAVVLWPIHQKFRLTKVLVSTYQAASGAGRIAMEELVENSKAVIEGREFEVREFIYPLAFNLIPHIDKFQDNGYTKEEMKVSWELKKIFNDDSFSVSCTAVRVPVKRAHSESIVIETMHVITPKDVRKVLEDAPGVDLVDDIGMNVYPMPITSSGKDNVEVGRIRQSLVFGDHGLEFFVSGDQLLRGAALNAIRIAELFL